MTGLELTLAMFLVASITVATVLIWYVRKVLLKLYMLQEIHSSAFEKIDSFKEHVIKTHELEMFYGDDTLQSLIKHSKELSDYLNDLSESVIFSYDDEEIPEEEEEEGE
jgi:hypothetical protein